VEKWRFVSDGVEFQNGAVDSTKLNFAPFKREEVEQFTASLEVAGRVYGLLRTARNAFASGIADYTDAVSNASVLLSELEKAGQQAELIATGIDVFFDPPEITKHVRDRDRLIAFAAETAKHLLAGNATR